MSLFDRFKKAAADARERLSEEAERATAYLARKGPGAVGTTAAELLAEQHYRKAAALVDGPLAAPEAQQIIALIAPDWNVDSNFSVLINRLLGQAYQVLGNLDAAREHYQRALSIVDDPAEAAGLRLLLVEETGLIPSDLALELVVERASLELAAGEYRAAVRWAMEALSRNERTLTAYYLQGVAMLRMGLPADEVSDLFVRALHHGGAQTVVDWVRELLPDRVEWFERLAE